MPWAKAGAPASGQDAGHAAYNRGTALENVSSGYCRHAFLPLVMPLGRSDAGLESLSVYRASVVQRMRTLSPAQYVGSMIICWCSTCSAVVASSPRNRVNSSQSSGAITSFPIVTAIRPAAWIVSALQPAHEPYRHNGPSRAATVLPWPSGFSPSYMKFGTGSWRNVIVAPRSRKSSASFVAGSLVSYGTNLPNTWRQACVCVGQNLCSA